MRHYLNTTLKGKQDDLGLNYYSVYFMFTVNRQTFKIKSRILNKRFRENEFDQVLTSNNSFLIKDQQVIDYCIQRSVNNSFIDIELFKNLYSTQCTSIVLWFEDFIRNERGRIMDDFFYGADLDGSDTRDLLNELERKYNIDRRAVLSYLNQYSIHHNKDINKYILVFDWHHLELRQDFIKFFNSVGIPSHHSNLIPFVDELITLI